MGGRAASGSADGKPGTPGGYGLASKRDGRVKAVWEDRGSIATPGESHAVRCSVHGLAEGVELGRGEAGGLEDGFFWNAKGKQIFCYF